MADWETEKEFELKQVIRCIHRIWYADNPAWTESPKMALELLEHMSELFNYAGITETLVENNPDKMSPEDFKERFVDKNE